MESLNLFLDISDGFVKVIFNFPSLFGLLLDTVLNGLLDFLDSFLDLGDRPIISFLIIKGIDFLSVHSII